MLVCFPGDAHVCINRGSSVFTTMLLLLAFWHILRAHIQIDIPCLRHVPTRIQNIFSFTPPDVCSSFFIDLVSHFQHPSSLYFPLWYPATAVSGFLCSFRCSERKTRLVVAFICVDIAFKLRCNTIVWVTVRFLSKLGDDTALGGYLQGRFCKDCL